MSAVAFVALGLGFESRVYLIFPACMKLIFFAGKLEFSDSSFVLAIVF